MSSENNGDVVVEKVIDAAAVVDVVENLKKPTTDEKDNGTTITEAAAKESSQSPKAVKATKRPADEKVTESKKAKKEDGTIVADYDEDSNSSDFGNEEEIDGNLKEEDDEVEDYGNESDESYDSEGLYQK